MIKDGSKNHYSHDYHYRNDPQYRTNSKKKPSKIRIFCEIVAESVNEGSHLLGPTLLGVPGEVFRPIRRPGLGLDASPEGPAFGREASPDGEAGRGDLPGRGDCGRLGTPNPPSGGFPTGDWAPIRLGGPPGTGEAEPVEPIGGIITSYYYSYYYSSIQHTNKTVKDFIREELPGETLVE